ncbi:MAG: ribosomal L7Ae/L30e/S12e/Gadd45 family protein [Clostridiales bacterium]|nr:ribosomal L7Ae/L30e/S12e/Gadd45 family protein [Clostridiales bacterium]
MTEINEKKLLSALGFAQKAGKVASGEFAAEKALKAGRAKLAVIDRKASDNAKKHWKDITDTAGVPLVFADEVGRAIGRDAHMIACVTDSGFAGMILLSRSNNEE